MSLRSLRAEPSEDSHSLNGSAAFASEETNASPFYTDIPYEASTRGPSTVKSPDIPRTPRSELWGPIEQMP